MESRRVHLDGTKLLLVLIACLLVLRNCDATTLQLKRRNRNVIVPSELFATQHSQSPFSHTYMYGAINSTFEYYTAIFLGSDRQMFMVQVDTGSASLAIPASNCKQYVRNGDSVTATSTKCAHADAFYNSDKSSHAKVSSCDSQCRKCRDGHCGFSLGYGDGSFLFGTLVDDDFEIAGLSTKLRFGQIEGESESFARTDVDGIMGIAYHVLDATDGDATFDKLVEAGQMSNEFSMCLGYHGGALVLGGMDAQYNGGSMSYTPIITESYYVVQMTDILVNGQSIKASSTMTFNDTIVDSGTTLLYLDDAAFNALVATFRASVCPKLPPEIRQICQPDSQGVSIFSTGTCFNLRPSDIQLFPNIEIVLQGATPLPIKPEHYFLRVTEGFCFGVGSSSGLGNILGDVFMQAYNTHFDRKNKRIGFAPVANCTFAPASMMLADGDGQKSTIGFEMSDPLVVIVLYEDGTPAVGLIVEFAAVSGSVKITNARTATDERGFARTKFTVKSAGTAVIRATLLEGNSIEFTATGEIGKIIGAVIGGIVGIIVVVIGVILGVRHYRRKTAYRRLSIYSEEDSFSLMQDVE